VSALRRLVESEKADRARIEKELALVREYRHWEVLGYESEKALLKMELGAELYRKVQQLAEEAQPPADTGRPPKGIQRIPLPKGGNSVKRLSARIAKKRPDILERMKKGEFKSVRAAAIEAGIVRPVSVINQFRRLWSQATAEERRQIRKIVTG
jgi:hypothetical protein